MFLQTKPLLTLSRTNKTLLRTIVSNVVEKTDSQSGKKLKTWKEIPGPSSVPILGVTINFLPIIGSFGLIQDFSILSDILYKKYGSIVRFEGGLGLPPIILLFDIDCIEQVLRSENTRMPERPGLPSLEFYRKKILKQTDSSGLLIEHGEGWKSFRSTVNPVLMQPKIVKLYSEDLDKIALEMVARLKTLRNEKNMIADGFELEMNKWALESIALVALGGRIGCISGDLPDDSPARQLIQCVRDTFEIADIVDNRPGLWRFNIQTPSFKRAMKVYEKQASLAKLFIKKAMEDFKKRENPPENKGVLEKLLEVDENVAVVMASDMLFAGVDTAAHTMIGTLYLLGTNPDKQAKLRKEILSTNKDERRPYLKSCLKEALRLLPIAGANMRRSTKEYNLKGYHIPKGMNLITMHEYASKMEEQFPRAQEYLPERWTTDKEDSIYHGHANSLAYSPFGFGVRMCIGKRIAELELETFLARIIENFEVEWHGPPPKRKTSPINYILGPYNFIFKDIK